jgi:hypothetical protein
LFGLYFSNMNRFQICSNFNIYSILNFFTFWICSNLNLFIHEYICIFYFEFALICNDYKFVQIWIQS